MSKKSSDKKKVNKPQPHANIKKPKKKAVAKKANVGPKSGGYAKGATGGNVSGGKKYARWV